MSLSMRPGAPEPLGLTLTEDGANIAVVSRHASRVELCLFDESGAETARLALPSRLGEVWFGFVEALREGQRYGLRAYGEAPQFDPRKLLVDPYARELDRAFALAPSMFAASNADSAADMPKAIARAVAPAAPSRALRPWRDLVVYELNVRGFTKRLETIPEAQRGTFAGLAQPAAIAHLVSLGVTAVELMPCAAWIDERHLPPIGLSNAWGYNPVAPMAPDPRLAPGGWREVQAATRALHEAGLEVILDVVLNHTGESDALGPTLSLRGLDDALYYRRARDGGYVNDAGCGNVLALDRPEPLRLALDALRAWARDGGVDGFRFDLATTLARRDDGFDAAAPFLAAIRQDPLLRELRLIAEPWDIGPGGYQLGGFPAGWGEWNDAYRDDVRRFWRGDAGMVGAMATRLSGSQDAFARKAPSRSVNFIVAHDGFTLADLVSYERKRNEANGERNRDGTNDNLSWNNGAEGASDDAAIRAARQNDQRALLATLLLSRGTPMLAMGAELGHTQAGNNNAYAQDNETSWLDWSAADACLLAFARRAVALRKAHPALTRDAFLTGAPCDETLIPDVVWLRPDGSAMRDDDWREACGLIAALYAPQEEGRDADRALVILNPSRDALDVSLPAPRDGFAWRLALESSAPDSVARTIDGRLVAPARAALLLVEARDAGRSHAAPDPALLDRLAQAAGLAPEWSEISGARHSVSEATKRALLKGLRLPVDSASAAREALATLAAERDLRALPLTAHARDGEAATLRVAGEPRRLALEIAREDGARHRIVVAPDQMTPLRWRGVDGRTIDGVCFALPAQPAGRHVVTRLDAPDAPCRLTVAPPAFLPQRLRGQGALGVAAQLYSVRRDGDLGVGDFETLAILAERAARAGAATLGLNPLHALFATQPDRASPYHPSDRRFLDPLTIALDQVAPIAGVPLHAPGADSSALVDYPRARGAKRAALQAAHAAFRARAGEAAHRDVANFVAEGGEALARFALHEALREALGEGWRNWPHALRTGDARALEDAARAHSEGVAFALFEQWIAARQFERASARGRDAGLWLGLYRDLAVGAAPDGAEAWREQDCLIDGASIGAPPDPFSATGQIWALPAPDPLIARREGYASFRALLAANMRCAGALRIDHAMGLERLFLVPDGGSGADGAYLSFPRDDLLAELALESARARCLVVAEDLGTVPDGFRDALADANVLGYRVLMFEQDGTGFRAPRDYPRLAVACAATHDLPTLAGWWESRDIDERQRLGQFDATGADAARRTRSDEKRRLVEALAREGLVEDDIEMRLAAPFDAALREAIHAFVAATPCALAMLQLDDLAGEQDGVNLPGTDRERPNWRRRVAVPVESLLAGSLPQRRPLPVEPT
jgi:glycogen operon protein